MKSKLVIKNNKVGYEKNGLWLPFDPNKGAPTDSYIVNKREIERLCHGIQDIKKTTWRRSPESLDLGQK